MIITVIIFILTLLILVVIHELGHFLVAKKFNIKVLEFGFGIPPRAIGKKVGETLVSLNWLPFGGFVRLLGEDEVNKEILENQRSFAAQKVWKRITVVVAGVVMNLILAWILFYVVLGAKGFSTDIPLLLDHQFAAVSQKNEGIVVVQKVNANSPAEVAGLKSGDRILAINDEKITNSSQLSERTKSSIGQEVKLTISDLEDRSLKTVTITPRKDPPEGEGPMGVALASFQIANLEYREPLQKLFAGVTHSYNLTVYSGKILGKLVGESFARGSTEPVSQTVAGPVGITTTVNTILTESKNPLISYLDFVALLSLNLAVLNIFPFPALDGGRLLFLLIEALSRRRVHAEVEKWVHTIGMAILLTLMLLVTFSDIRKIFS